MSGSPVNVVTSSLFLDNRLCHYVCTVPGLGALLRCNRSQLQQQKTNKDSSMTSNDELLYFFVGAGQPGEGLGPATGVMRYKPLSLAAGARA